MKRALIAGLLIILGAGGAYTYLRLSRRSSDTGERTPPGSAELCAEHRIAEADCPWCDPALIAERGECVAHGVPEALCSRCNPALETGFRVEGDWCAGHGVPESQCALCNPELVAGGLGAPTAPAPNDVEVVAAREVPRHLRAPSVACETSTQRIQFRSPRIAADAGLEYARVERREVTQTLVCNAELAFDGNRYAHLASRAPGVVREVAADLGQSVEAGDLLAVVDSPDLGTAKAEYLQAGALVSLWERHHAREQALLESRAGTEREALEAEAKLAESRILLSRAAQRLRTLGLDDDAVAGLGEAQDTSSLLHLTAPFAGTVIARSAVLGEVVDTSTPLFSVADTTVMWALLEVYDADVTKIALGQPVVLQVEGLAGERRGGTLTWVSSQVDRRTRTLAARAEFPNPDGALRAGMFATAVVSVRDRAAELVVPEEAVQWEGCCNVVFVRQSDSLFEPRKVRLAFELERHLVVAEGLDEGETVVTTGSFLLKTELLKGSIGAGCCEVDPGR